MTHFCICEPVANKLCKRLAPNWLSIYLYVTTLCTHDGSFPASPMFRQYGHKFGPLKNGKKRYFDCNIYSFIFFVSKLFYGTWAENVVSQ